MGPRDGPRTLESGAGEIGNDGLIIASGGRFIRKVPGVEHSITPCGGIDAIVKIRDTLASTKGGTLAFGFGGNPKEPSAMRGGPVFQSNGLPRSFFNSPRFFFVFMRRSLAARPGWVGILFRGA